MYKDVTFINEEGEEVTISFPARYEVCDDCGGRGTTYLGWTSSEQPAFTSEDFDREGPDFEEDYMNGAYDRPCPTCKGIRVVKVIQEHLITHKELKAQYASYQAHLQAEAEYRAEIEAERRFGC